MRIWEIINMDDPVTFLSEDKRYAVAVALILGNGNYGLRECFVTEKEAFEMPIFVFYKKEIVENWIADTFKEEGIFSMDSLLDSLDKLRYANILRTVQVCSSEERLSYQKALEVIDDLEKRRKYIHWWKKQRRSSLNDIAEKAWNTANIIERKYREEHQSAS